MGLEPTRHECHKILSLARLPVPTLPHFAALFVYLSHATNNIIPGIAENVNNFFYFFDKLTYYSFCSLTEHSLRLPSPYRILILPLPFHSL